MVGFHQLRLSTMTLQYGFIPSFALNTIDHHPISVQKDIVFFHILKMFTKKHFTPYITGTGSRSWVVSHLSGLGFSKRICKWNDWCQYQFYGSGGAPCLPSIMTRHSEQARDITMVASTKRNMARTCTLGTPSSSQERN